MAKTMKAAVVRELGKPLTIEEVKIPEVGPGQALLKVISTGVCHTDLHAVTGDWLIKPQPPFIPGHEGVGYVAAVGSGVSVVKEGDRIGVPWLYSACGYCEFCLTGWETLCKSQKNAGYSVDGSFAEYVLVDPNYVGHIPAGLEFTPVAPILCAGVTVYKGLKQTRGPSRTVGGYLWRRRSRASSGAVRQGNGTACGSSGYCARQTGSGDETRRRSGSKRSPNQTRHNGFSKRPMEERMVFW